MGIEVMNDRDSRSRLSGMALDGWEKHSWMASDESDVADTATQLRLQAALAEYQALRAEVLQKLSHHLKLYAITVTGVSVLVGWALTTQRYDVLLAVPIPATALAFRYLWEQTVIVMIGDYLRLMEREIFPALVGKRTEPQNKHERLWIGWEHYFHGYPPRLALYKPAIVILLVLVPFAPAAWHNGASLCDGWFGIHIGWGTSLPLGVHVATLVVYPVLAVYLSWKLCERRVHPRHANGNGGNSAV